MKKRNILLIVLTVILIGTLSFQMGPGSSRARPTVAEINAQIKANAACWHAAENKFSYMTDEQLKGMLGAFPPGLEPGDRELSYNESQAPVKVAATAQAGLPGSWDWRTTKDVSPIKDQGNCGSCWAFATVAQMESLSLIYKNNPIDLSEQFIVSCDTSDYGCNGGYMNRVYNFVQKTGTTDDNCFPYVQSDVPCSNHCSDWASRITKIKSWSWVCQTKLDNNLIKQAVSSNGPLTCTMDVYYDFFNYSGGCYQHVKGAYAGGHAVLIVGWTSDNCWIVKNSWGPDWGENGYFRIKFSNCRIGLNSAKFSL
jgi:C1A family cysteine protease